MRSTKLPSWTRRLAGLEPVASPPHVFVLDETRLRYGQFVRERQGFRFRGYRHVMLPRDAFLSGVLGGPLRDPAGFQKIVGGLVRGIQGGVKEASLVIPDAWLRVTFAESGELPTGAAALDDVLRWKLRRLVPFRVDELRVSATLVAPLPGQAEPRRLLLGFAVEQLLAQLEDAFAGAGVRIGQISNVSLSLVEALEERDTGGFAVLAVVDADGYTLVFARGREPVIHRYKALTGSLPEAARGSFVDRDLKLTRNFLAEQFPGSPLGPVLLVAPPELAPVWLPRLEEGLGAPAALLDGSCLPPLRAEGEGAPPWRELAPMLGAARREVA